MGTYGGKLTLGTRAKNHGSEHRSRQGPAGRDDRERARALARLRAIVNRWIFCTVCHPDYLPSGEGFLQDACEQIAGKVLETPKRENLNFETAAAADASGRGISGDPDVGTKHSHFWNVWSDERRVFCGQQITGTSYCG